MPLPKKEDALPNKPLNGSEIRQYIISSLAGVFMRRDVLEGARSDLVLDAVNLALANDCYFREAQVYRNPSISIAFRYHACGDKWAFTVTPVLSHPNPILPKVEPFIRRPVGVPAPPLDSRSADEEHVVDAFTLKLVVRNPNLIRVHFGLPVKMTVEKPQKPGVIFKEFETREYVYPKDGAELLPEPEIIEETEEFRKQWGLPVEEAILLRRESSRGHTPLEEVETVSVGPMNRAERRAQKK